MAKLKTKIKELSLVRVLMGLALLLIGLGRWEYHLLKKRTVVLKVSWLIALGRLSERLFLAFIKFIFGGLTSVRRLILGLIIGLLKLADNTMKGLLWFVAWPFRSVANLLLKTTQVIKKTSPLRTVKTKVKKSFWSLSQPKLRPALFKPVLAFAAVILLLILPLKFYNNYLGLSLLKTKIVNATKEAVADVFSAKEAAENNDFLTAEAGFSRSGENFLTARAELDQVNGFLLKLAGWLPADEVKLAALAKPILEAGTLGTGLAADLSLAVDNLFGPNRPANLLLALADFETNGLKALAKAQSLQTTLATIDVDKLPAEYKTDFKYWREQVDFLTASLSELTDMAGRLKIFLGEAEDKRYLLVFQNTTEARAPGGFMGSFAVVDFSRGQLKKITVPGGGTYDTEAGLKRFIQSPAPLQLVKARWFLWDANWWPDWPRSARKIMWFYEQSDGSTVDGVISLTPSVVIKLLKDFGPVDLTADYGVTVTADNFLDVVQSFSEQAYGPTDKPKAIIGDLMDKLLVKIGQAGDKGAYLKLISTIEEALNEKHILLYFADDKLETKIKDLGWDGSLLETSGDYLSVVNSNIAGGKSDKDIKQTIELTTNILSDGSLINNLTIIRDHQGKRSQGYSGQRNVNWLRVYVPLGSKLMTAEGFKAPEAKYFEQPEEDWALDPDLLNEQEAEKDEASQTAIYREQNKTVFANWSMVDPGEVAVIKLSYKLPFKLATRTQTDETWLKKIATAFTGQNENLYRHSLLVQKQSGAVNSEINYRLAIPSYYETVWRYGQGEAADYQLQTSDKYWAVLLKDKIFSTSAD